MDEADNQLTREVDNKFVPTYVPNNLKWFERDGLETWYRQNKCNELLNNTDTYSEKMKIVNFDIIDNDPSKNQIKQYQTIDHDKIKCYPPHFQEQIRSSIFRNATRKDMHVEKNTIKKHFTHKKASADRERFIKKN